MFISVVVRRTWRGSNDIRLICIAFVFLTVAGPSLANESDFYEKHEVIVDTPEERALFLKALNAMSEQNYQMAANIFENFAGQGDPASRQLLGGMYLEGWGVIQDPEEAVKWLLAAAEGGMYINYATVGLMYRDGRLVDKDITRSTEYFRKGAELGDTSSQNELAVHYSRRSEGDYDLISAYMWAAIAARTGSENGYQMLPTLFDLVLKERMSAAELAEAERRIKACLASNYQDCDGSR